MARLSFLIIRLLEAFVSTGLGRGQCSWRGLFGRSFGEILVKVLQRD